MRIIKQLIIAILFVGQLGAVVWFNRADQVEDRGNDEALKRYGFYLRESAKDCGIDFVHQGPENLDAKLAHIMPLIASMGASVSVVDFNRDGRPDLYVVTGKEGGKNRLYKNLGDGKFVDVAGEMGVADLNTPDTGICMGAVWGDFDNDGYEDLLVYKWGKPELFRNIGGKHFERVTAKANLPKWVNANSAVWLDFDRDGKLDLLIAGYWPDDIDLSHLANTRMMPESFEYANNGGRKYLLRNKGDGTFEDVTAKMGVTSTRWTLGVVAADLCGSGYPDLVFANDYGVSEFYCNKGGKGFEEVGAKVGIGVTPKSGMNASLGDVFSDGRLSIYISNITDPGNLVQHNNLWVPLRKSKSEPGSLPKYRNEATELHVASGGWSWSAKFGDLDNDGLQDLFLTNGYVSANPSDNYWFEYGLIAGGNKFIIGDARNWPAIKGRGLAGYQPKCLWWNRGGEFVDIARAVGVKENYDGRAVALVDLWGRGVLDVVVANQHGPLLVYKNTVKKDRQWVQFDLEGTKSNRSAIGAQVRLFWTKKGSDRTQEQVQVINGGNAHASQNMHTLHFGLGEQTKIEKAFISWPSGTTQTLEAPKANTVHRIKESQS